MDYKSRTILVESNNGHRKLFSLNLGVFVATEIIHKHNADAVIDFLKEDHNIQLIVTEESVDNEQTVLKIYYYLKSNNLSIPIILSGQCSKLVGEIDMYYKSDWRRIVKQAAKILEVSAKEMARSKVSQHFPIAINTLLPMVQAPVDIYIKRKGGERTLLFKAGTKIDRGVVEQQLLKNTDSIYILANERLKFTNDFSQQVFDFLKNGAISVEDRIKATSLAFDHSRETIKKVGLTDRSIEMAKATVDSIVRVSASSSGLSDLMDILCKSNDSYLYSHSLLISVIAHHIIGEMGWGSKNQKVKFAFAAFFHDITIPDDDLCRINSKKELDEHKLSKDDKKSVLYHALNAAQLLKDSSRYSPWGGFYYFTNTTVL